MTASAGKAQPRARRSVAAWNVRYLFAYAEHRGLTRESLLGRFEIDRASLEDVDGRIPLDAFVRMWNELPGLVGDPDMPLHVLEHALVDEPPLNALVFLMAATSRSAPTATA